MVMIYLSLGPKIKPRGNVLHIVLAALGLALLLAAGLPSPAVAGGESTIVGTLSLAPAFENIGVISEFSGDDNGNNNAILEYREVLADDWKPGISMTVDRRDFLYEFPLAGEPDNNPIPNEWKNQWRAVIFGLSPNTEYQVRVTYTDPDGITGSPVVATIRTRNDNPPSNGNTYYVSNAGDDSSPGTFDTPFRTIQHAASIVNPGDTVLVMPGTYTEEGSGAPWRTGITIDRSGTSDNYITFRSYDLDNKAVIDGAGSLRFGFRLFGSYIRIKGFDLRNFNGDPGGCVVVREDGQQPVGNIIEDNIMTDPGGCWACAAVLLCGRDTLIQRNQMLTTGIGEMASNYGVNFYGTDGGNVIRDNVITTQGTFRDGIGGIGNMRIWGGPGPNSFIYDNYVYGPYDDGLEIEGGNLNVAVWGNFIENNDLTEPGGVGMNMGLGLTSTIVGPMYAFRNIIVNHGDAAIKLGSDSFGNIYLYHNTIYAPRGGAGPSHFGNNAVADNVHLRNNIILTYGGRSFEIWGSSADDHGLNSWDYDAFWSTRDSPYGLKGAWYGDRYGTLSSFQTGTGQEIHGMVVEDPMFVDADDDDFTLQSTSPLIDKGVVLPGFNDADSPWPYQGAAPDIGACESAHGSFPGPLHHIDITPGSASLEFSQTWQFTATGYDQDNNEITGLSFTWSVINAGAGSIDGNGLFTAGTIEGKYPDVVKAEAESIAGYASVSIALTAPSFPWGLFGGILGGVLGLLAVAAIAIYLVVLRRREADASE
jgi:hypothetical protein